MTPRASERPAGTAEAGRQKATAVALLAAFALFLSGVEFIIPKPLPFLRLGLTNLAFLAGLRVLKPRELVLLAVFKIAAQNLLFGTLFSHAFLLSFCGTVAGCAVMFAFDRLGRGRVSLIGVSVAGAAASNLAQIGAASLDLIWGPAAWLVAPPFLFVGLGTSLALGVIAERFTAQSEWVRRRSPAVEKSAAGMRKHGDERQPREKRAGGER